MESMKSDGGNNDINKMHTLDTNITQTIKQIELERLNMFPDNHTAGQPDSKRAFFMGSASQAARPAPADTRKLEVPPRGSQTNL